MSDPKDLQLRYKFTDRGGNDVYNIYQELLSSVCEPIEQSLIGEMRIAPDRSIFSVDWVIPTRIHGHGTG